MFSRLAVFAGLALPLVQATALYAASLPQAVHSSVASGSCKLPDDFEIQGLGGLSQNGTAFSTLDFVFYDNSTLIKTQCHLNASSVPVVVGGRTPRYPCDDPDVFFIFQEDKLTMIETLCPGDDGINDLEASGSMYPVLPACNSTMSAGPKVCTLASGPLVANRFSSFNVAPTASEADA